MKLRKGRKQQIYSERTYLFEASKNAQALGMENPHYRRRKQNPTQIQINNQSRGSVRRFLKADGTEENCSTLHHDGRNSSLYYLGLMY